MEAFAKMFGENPQIPKPSFETNLQICTVSITLGYMRLRGATVARLAPVQKAACSNHVGVNPVLLGLLTILLQYILSDTLSFQNINY